MSSAALVKGVANGMMDFDAVWNLYYARVHRWVRRRVWNAQDAEEATDDVFIRAWLRRDQYDPSKRSVLSWLYLNAETITIGFIRSRKEQPLRLDLISEERGPSEGGPEEDHRAAEQERRVRRAVDDLPGPEASVMRCRYFDCLTWPATSRALKMSQRNAQYRRQRGIELLRGKLAAG
jgi:RNA polymerase sigma-70 factor, ECF subfamily